MMELPFVGFSEAFGTKIAIGVLTVATAVTSGVAGYKIVKTVSAESPEVTTSVEVPKSEPETVEQASVTVAPKTPSLTPTPTIKHVTPPVTTSVAANKIAPALPGRISDDDDEDGDEDDDRKEYEMESKSSEEKSHQEEKETEDYMEKPESGVTPTPLP